MPTWPAATTIGGFEVQEYLFSADTVQPGPSNDGDRANLSYDNEKGVNVVIAGRQGILGVRIFGTLAT